MDFSFYGLYSNADIIVKNVIWILSLFSILTWCVLFVKLYQYYSVGKMIKNDFLILKNITNFENINKNTNFSAITKNFINDINDEVQKSSDSIALIKPSSFIDSSLAKTSNFQNLDSKNIKNRLKIRLESLAQSLIIKMRLGAIFLASVGSCAPFIGLFGTVWGIMNSFIGIAKADNASLSIVAPGIAEALFATAFGLLAAIPAVLFYNLLSRVGVTFSHQLDKVITHLYLSVDRAVECKGLCDDEG